MRPLLLLLVLLALAPSAAAGADLRGRAYLLPTVDRVDAWANVTILGLDASQARAEADGVANGGNENGRVETAEARAYEDTLRARTEQGLTAPYARLDDRDPTRQRAGAVHIRGLEGAVESMEPFEYDLLLVLEFDAIEVVGLHAITRDVGANDKGPVLVRVPPAHLAILGKGIGNYVVSADGRTVQGENDGRTDLEVRFGHKDAVTETPTSAAPQPAGEDRRGIRVPGTPLLLAAAAIALALRPWSRA